MTFGFELRACMTKGLALRFGWKFWLLPCLADTLHDLSHAQALPVWRAASQPRLRRLRSGAPLVLRVHSRHNQEGQLAALIPASAPWEGTAFTPRVCVRRLWQVSAALAARVCVTLVANPIGTDTAALFLAWTGFSPWQSAVVAPRVCVCCLWQVCTALAARVCSALVANPVGTNAGVALTPPGSGAPTPAVARREGAAVTPRVCMSCLWQGLTALAALVGGTPVADPSGAIVGVVCTFSARVSGHGGKAQLLHQVPGVAYLGKALPHCWNALADGCAGGLALRAAQTLHIPSLVSELPVTWLRDFQGPDCLHLAAFVVLTGAAASHCLQRARRSSFVRFFLRVSSKLKSASVRFCPSLAALHLEHARGLSLHILHKPGSVTGTTWHHARKVSPRSVWRDWPAGPFVRHARRALSMPCATTLKRAASSRAKKRAEATAQQHRLRCLASCCNLALASSKVMVGRCVSMRSPWPKRLGPNGRLTHKSSARFARDRHV